MEIQNNKEEVPFSHYLALFEKLDPQEAAKRCGVSFEDGCFTVQLLNSTYRFAAVSAGRTAGGTVAGL